MAIPAWLVHSIITFLLFGLWGFFGKVASRSLTPQNLLLISNIGWVSILPFFYILYRKYFALEWGNHDFYFALLSGLAGSAGALFFYFALDKGDTTRVVAITAAYPLVASILSFIVLHESITPLKIGGLFLTIIGIYLLSI